MRSRRLKYTFHVIVVAVVIAFAISDAIAQISKQVEVTKAYIPEIAPAQKLSHTPNMSDTVRLRPEISYQVTPHSIESRLAQSIYKPTDIEYIERRQREDFYIKAGVGLPFQTEGDFYFSRPINSDSYLLGYINHTGQYTDIDDVKASRSSNRFGVAYSSDLSLDKVLDLNMFYNLNTWSRYATATPKSVDPRYNLISINAAYGDKFLEWSQWNWGLDVGLNRFWNNSDVNSTSFDISTKLGHEIGSGKFVASLDFKTIGGGGDDSYKDYGDNTVIFGVNYNVGSVNNLKASVGLAYAYDRVKMGATKETRGYLLPSLTLKYSTLQAFIPFLEVESTVSHNDYASLSVINPYIVSGGFVGANSVNYDIRAGFEGVAEARLSYRLYAGYTIGDNALYWALIEQQYTVDSNVTRVDNYYAVTSATRKSLSLNFESEFMASRNFGITADMSLSKYYDSKDVAWSNSLPSFKMGLGMKYTVGEVTFDASAAVEGVSYTTLISQNTTQSDVVTNIKTPTTVNIGLGVDWRTNDKLAIYMRGDNLANANLYRWMGYKECGVGVIAGVKLEF